MKWFIYYYFISGVLSFLMTWWEINYSEDKDKMEDMIADVTWATGIKREIVKYLVYSLSIICGFILVPCNIYAAIFGKDDEDEG